MARLPGMENTFGSIEMAQRSTGRGADVTGFDGIEHPTVRPSNGERLCLITLVSHLDDDLPD